MSSLSLYIHHRRWERLLGMVTLLLLTFDSTSSFLHTPASSCTGRCCSSIATTPTLLATATYPSRLSRPYAVVNDNGNDDEQQQNLDVPTPPMNLPSELELEHPQMQIMATTSKEPDFFRFSLRRLAALSLEDYEWRSGFFKAQEADRLIEISVARMRGQDPNYLRPMDAQEEKLGPLGRWEKAAVEWLSSVVEEEGRRAQTIVEKEGRLVRPIEGNVLGPLGFLEKTVVDFLNRLRASERERMRTKTLRPKDLAAHVRGPLGDLEKESVRILKQIEASETLRAQQIKSRGGEIVRPIDVPGPLGDLEMAISELFQAEKLRSQERRQRDGTVVRPKDAKYRGPLGDAEYQAYEAIKQLNQEEMNRLQSIQKLLQDRRPMETNRDSALGILESILVGILRAPRILMSVVDRVKELLSSSELLLSEADQEKLLSTRRGKEGEGQDDDGKQFI